jgi:hypothetical protein
LFHSNSYKQILFLINCKVIDCHDPKAEMDMSSTESDQIEQKYTPDSQLNIEHRHTRFSFTETLQERTYQNGGFKGLLPIIQECLTPPANLSNSLW